MKNARHGDGARDLIASCRVCRGDSNGVGAMVLGPMVPEKIEILAMEPSSKYISVVETTKVRCFSKTFFFFQSRLRFGKWLPRRVNLIMRRLAFSKTFFFFQSRLRFGKWLLRRVSKHFALSIPSDRAKWF